jgi:hypothetical protein
LAPVEEVSDAKMTTVNLLQISNNSYSSWTPTPSLDRALFVNSPRHVDVGSFGG